MMSKDENKQSVNPTQMKLQFMLSAIHNSIEHPYPYDPDLDKFQKQIGDGIIAVFVTPQQLIELGVGYKEGDFTFNQIELDEYIPVSLTELFFAMKDYLLGRTVGREVELDVPGSECKVNFVININGKYCKLNEDDWDVMDNFVNLRPTDQVKLFQRLLNQGQIAMEDLEASDINTEVYKQLMLNEEMGQELFNEKVGIVKGWVLKQKTSQELNEKYRMMMDSLCETAV